MDVLHLSPVFSFSKNLLYDESPELKKRIKARTQLLMLCKRKIYKIVLVLFCALINFVYVSNSYTDTYSHTHIHIFCKSMKSYEIMLKFLINFIGQVWRCSTIQVKACIRSRGMLAQAGIKEIKDCNKRFG